MLARKFYPWIKGGRKNAKLDELQKKTGCKINVPPYQVSWNLKPLKLKLYLTTYFQKGSKFTNICNLSQVESEEVIVMGEKDKVSACIDLLEKECKYMEENFSNIQVEIRQAQHKYIERGGGNFIFLSLD